MDIEILEIIDDDDENTVIKFSVENINMDIDSYTITGIKD